MIPRSHDLGKVNDVPIQANNVPKDNVEYWISKSTGSAAQDQLEEVVYEGLGPGSVQIIVRGLTDNRKRTFPFVRHHFTYALFISSSTLTHPLHSKHGGEIGAPGSVMWNFHKTGFGTIKATNKSVEQIQELCIDNGADDVGFDEESNTVEWYCSISDLLTIRKAAENEQLEVETAEIIYRPKDTMEVPEDQEEAFRGLLEALEDEPDVQDVFHNAS